MADSVRVLQELGERQFEEVTLEASGHPCEGVPKFPCFLSGNFCEAQIAMPLLEAADHMLGLKYSIIAGLLGALGGATGFPAVKRIGKFRAALLARFRSLNNFAFLPIKQELVRTNVAAQDRKPCLMQLIGCQSIGYPKAP